MIITNARSWLCTQAQYDARPDGTISAILNAGSANYSEPFAGKLTVATRGDNPSDAQLMAIGWVNAPECYPNGNPILDPTAFEPTWETKTTVDPCFDKSDDEILLSATLRGLI
jgi:hypothetical protein